MQQASATGTIPVRRSKEPMLKGRISVKYTSSFLCTVGA